MDTGAEYVTFSETDFHFRSVSTRLFVRSSNLRMFGWTCNRHEFPSLIESTRKQMDSCNRMMADEKKYEKV